MSDTKSIRIVRIQVNGLFGRYNHNFTLEQKDRVTILFGMNGKGKTTILRLFEAVLNHSPGYLADVVFSDLRLTLSNGRTLTVLRKWRTTIVHEENDITAASGDRTESENMPGDSMEVTPKTSEAYLDSGSGKPTHIFIEEQTSENEEESSLQRQAYIPVEEEEQLNRPQWLSNALDNLRAVMLGTDRLMSPGTAISSPDAEPSRRSSHQVASLPTILNYADRLKNRMQDIRIEYDRKAQELDNSFPRRVLEQRTSGGSRQEFGSILGTLRGAILRRERLHAMGLVSADPEQVPDNLEGSDTTLAAFMKVYTEDAIEKLEITTQFVEQAKTLETAINTRLDDLKITVNAQDGITVETIRGPQQTIPLNGLSSGVADRAILYHAAPGGVYQPAPDGLYQPRLTVCTSRA